MEHLLTCRVCYDTFDTDPSLYSTDEERRGSHLPVFSAVCSHKICCSCLNDWQLSASSRSGRPPKWFACPWCKEEKAFNAVDLKIDIFACECFARMKANGSLRKRKWTDNAENKIHLVFPFVAEEKTFEDACKNLQELGGKVPVDSEDGLKWEAPVLRKGHGEDSSLASHSAAAAASASEDDGEGGFSSTSSAPSKTSTRTHFMTIRQDEMERLEQGKFLNGALINFFMRW